MEGIHRPVLVGAARPPCYVDAGAVRALPNTRERQHTDLDHRAEARPGRDALREARRPDLGFERGPGRRLEGHQRVIGTIREGTQERYGHLRRARTSRWFCLPSSRPPVGPFLV